MSATRRALFFLLLHLVKFLAPLKADTSYLFLFDQLGSIQTRMLGLPGSFVARERQRLVVENRPPFSQPPSLQSNLTSSSSSYPCPQFHLSESSSPDPTRSWTLRTPFGFPILSLFSWIAYKHFSGSSNGRAGSNFFIRNPLGIVLLSVSLVSTFSGLEAGRKGLAALGSLAHPPSSFTYSSAFYHGPLVSYRLSGPRRGRVIHRPRLARRARGSTRRAFRTTELTRLSFDFTWRDLLNRYDEMVDQEEDVPRGGVLVLWNR